MIKSLPIIFTICSAVALVAGSKHTSPPPVELSLIAPWFAPDPFLEILELVKKENPLSYIECLMNLPT
ncbi:unnamed protein product [Absidia cylindrospora]